MILLRKELGQNHGFDGWSMAWNGGFGSLCSKFWRYFDNLFKSHPLWHYGKQQTNKCVNAQPMLGDLHMPSGGRASNVDISSLSVDLDWICDWEKLYEGSKFPMSSEVWGGFFYTVKNPC